MLPVGGCHPEAQNFHTCWFYKAACFYSAVASFAEFTREVTDTQMPLVAPVILPEMYKIFTMAEVQVSDPGSQQMGLSPGRGVVFTGRGLSLHSPQPIRFCRVTERRSVSHITSLLAHCAPGT